MLHERASQQECAAEHQSQRLEEDAEAMGASETCVVELLEEKRAELLKLQQASREQRLQVDHEAQAARLQAEEARMMTREVYAEREAMQAERTRHKEALAAAREDAARWEERLTLTITLTITITPIGCCALGGAIGSLGAKVGRRDGAGSGATAP